MKEHDIFGIFDDDGQDLTGTTVQENQKDSGKSSGNTPEQDSGQQATKSDKKPAGKKDAKRHPEYDAYRDSASKADATVVTKNRQYYADAEHKVTQAETDLRKADEAYRKAQAERQSLNGRQIHTYTYRATVGDTDMVALLSKAEERWMTPGQLNYMQSSPDDYLDKMKFRSKSEMDQYGNQFLNSEFMVRLANPDFTKDDVRRAVRTDCLLVALIGLVLCLLCRIQVPAFDIVGYVGAIFPGMGAMYILTGLLTTFLSSQKDKEYGAKVGGLVLELILSYVIGDGIVQIIHHSTIPLTVVLSVVFCGLSALFMANAAATNVKIRGALLKNNNKIQDTLYRALFFEAAKIPETDDGMYGILHYAELATLIEQRNLSIDMGIADSEISMRKNQLDTAKTKLEEANKQRNAAKSSYELASRIYRNGLQAVEDWKRSPSVVDLAEYNKKIQAEDPYFPDVIWCELPNDDGKLGTVWQICHGRMPIEILMGRHSNAVGTLLSETVTELGIVLKGIQKICSNEITRIMIVDPQANNISMRLGEAGFGVTSFDRENYKKEPAGTVFTVATRDAYMQMGKEIEQKKTTLNSFLNSNRDRGDDPKLQKNSIGTANILAARNGNELFSYDILLIYVPVEGSSDSSLNIGGELGSLLGSPDDCSRYGILPIYFCVYGAEVHHSWQALVNSCQKKLTFTT